MGSCSYADGIEQPTVRGDVRVRAVGLGVVGTDSHSDAQAAFTEKVRFRQSIEQLLTLVQQPASTAHTPKNYTESASLRERSWSAMGFCSHAEMSEEANVQSDAQVPALADMTDAAAQGDAQVSTKPDVTEEATAQGNAQVPAVADMIEAAAMQGDAKALTMADMTEEATALGNAQVTVVAEITEAAAVQGDAQAPSMAD